MFHLVLTAVLFAFWLLLSGHFEAWLLGLGAASAVLVVTLLRRMARTDGAPILLRPGLGLVRYLFWLAWQIVRANADLARRIWDPELPIRPVWRRLDTQVSTPLERTLYANSITITPGTLTTDVREDHFMVHALSAEGIEQLRAGEMERRIRRLGL